MGLVLFCSPLLHVFSWNWGLALGCQNLFSSVSKLCPLRACRPPGPKGPHLAGFPVASFTSRSLTRATPSACCPARPVVRCVASVVGVFVPTFPAPSLSFLRLPAVLAAPHLLPVLCLL